jgi:hypothetical protein
MLSRRDFLTAAAIPAALAAQTPRGPIVPRRASELIITLTSKEQIFLSNFRGKVVALEILLTTCPHCQKCSKLLQDFFVEYGAKGFQPLGAAVNDNAQMLLLPYIHSLGLKYPVGVAAKEPAYSFLQVTESGGPIYMPQLVFIDREGTIRAQYAGTDKFFLDEEKNIRREIEALLKPAKSARGSR